MLCNEKDILKIEEHFAGFQGPVLGFRIGRQVDASARPEVASNKAQIVRDPPPL